MRKSSLVLKNPLRMTYSASVNLILIGHCAAFRITRVKQLERGSMHRFLIGKNGVGNQNALESMQSVHSVHKGLSIQVENQVNRG